jgi:antitoxin (DNA-binding transcriptional repressor) of toxin-antitoxin stability system
MDNFFHRDKDIIGSKDWFLSPNNTLVTCQNVAMKRMSLGKFQANCPVILENVQQTNETVLITRQGKPLVKVIPAKRSSAQKLLGPLEGKIKIVGDIESPIWLG